MKIKSINIIRLLAFYKNFLNFRKISSLNFDIPNHFINSAFSRFHFFTFSHFNFFFFIFHISLFTVTFSQVNYEPATSSVYSFLERMSAKGIIQTNEEIMPYSRMEIAGKLQRIFQYSKMGISVSQNLNEKQNDKSLNTNSVADNDSKNKSQIRDNSVKISGMEENEFIFYIREYAVELDKLGFDLTDYEVKHKLIDLKNDNFGFDKYNRFRILSYSNDSFGLFIDPILGYSYNSFRNGSLWSYSNGLRLYGNFGNNFGFELQFCDNHPRGDNLDRYRKFTSLTGYEFKVGQTNGFDFDRMNANINYSWSWGSLTLGKDFNYYGSGENGKLILSDKAPSFPFIKFEAQHSDWFRFSYIHGYLNSQIIDSSDIRIGTSRDHYPKIEKYFVTHMFSFTPLSSLNISLGESVIYSDRFEPIYLIPVAFFRLADHYLTDPDESAGNAQLFASIWYKNFTLKTKFYGSIFIDELSAGNSDYPQAVAYNLGIKSIDPIIPESELILEYSRINPFVYFHVDKAQTYANYGYEMGHWIGSNADQIYLSFKKRIIRGLNFNLYYSVVRKGSEESFDELRYQDYQTFLWGEKNQVVEYGCNLSYEILHNFNLKFDYKNIDEKLNKKLLLYEGNLIAFSIGYGL
ncbi:MAG: hypothetical protein IPK06_02310 [Ignavibacteriae bacterium]|nr:hypothetical protein [Ignavibacteriota bacterium]